MTHQLTKKLQHLKKKIKQFEEQFEKERNYKVESPLFSLNKQEVQTQRQTLDREVQRITQSHVCYITCSHKHHSGSDSFMLRS